MIEDLDDSLSFFYRSGKNSGKLIKVKSLDITETSNINAFINVRYIKLVPAVGIEPTRLPA